MDAMKSYSPQQNLHSMASNYGANHTRHSGYSNSQNYQRMQFVSDLGSWIEQQQQLILSMNETDRTERINGVHWVVKTASKAYELGEPFDISQLPMAPSKDQAPSLDGLAPGLSQALMSFNIIVASKWTESLQASTDGVFSNSSSASVSAPPIRANGKLGEIVAIIMGMDLPIAGERGTYPVQQFGDRVSVEKILQQCVAMGIRSPDQVAYILATAWLESRLGKWMTESAWLSEKSAERYAEQKYGPNGNNPQRARQLGNTQRGDGARYMGRGYVQLTWKNNYERMSKLLIDNDFSYTEDGVTYGDGLNGTEKIDLVTNYRHVNRNKDLAARILVLGMDGGHYVGDGRGLDHYIPEDQEASIANFDNARRIVNGTDKRRHVTEIALKFSSKLRSGDLWAKVFSA